MKHRIQSHCLECGKLRPTENGLCDPCILKDSNHDYLTRRQKRDRLHHALARTQRARRRLRDV